MPIPDKIDEGWGICSDGNVLYITDGSNMIFVVDPNTIQIIDTLYIIYDD